MRLSLELKKRLVNLVVETFAGAGLFAFTLGSAIAFLGLTGTAAIKLGKMLNPYRGGLKAVMFYGSTGVGTGLFLIGAGMAIADTIGEKIIEEELDIEFGNTILIPNRKIPHVCVGCKNYHGHIYNDVPLICAIHPHGREGMCPDWLGYAEKN